MRVTADTPLVSLSWALFAALLWVSHGAQGAAAIEDIDSQSGRSAEGRGGGAVPVPRGGAAAAPPTANLPLQERVQRLERVVGNQALVDMLRRLEELQLEVQTLRAQVEELGHGLEGMQSRQRDIYLDVDRRIQQMEGRGGPASSLPDAGLGAGPAAAGSAPEGDGVGAGLTATAPPAADAASARAAYEQAFGALREGRYEQAISGFERFVADYPQSEYAGNAQYWLGEANYVTRRFERAIQEFNKLITHYPDSAKVPDAHLKIGFTYYELGKWADARRALTQVQNRHSNSAAARLAAERLSRMAQEGH